MISIITWNFFTRLFFNRTLSINEPKISFFSAIIGGGIGGGATAYFLRQQFGPDLDVTVFERGRIGGRLATVKIAGNTYEVGGSVIHPDNKLMTGLVETL